MTELDRVAIWATGTSARAIVERARHRGFRRFARPIGRRLRVDGAPWPFEVRAVGTPAELEAVLTEASKSARPLVRWTGDRVIPLENALARAGPHRTVAVLVDRAEELPATLGALERGADLAVVPVDTVDALELLEHWLERPAPVSLDWVEVRVTRNEPSGPGDRILVDTTRLLDPTEGLLVGSAARLLFPVASEATGSEFSRPRPFRINAGAPHSYVLLPDGTTRYLSELEAGDRVLVTGPGRPAVVARVGRLKIERRPLRLLEATDGRSRATVFLQDAETVRLLGPKGPVPIGRIAPGDRFRAVRLPAARHLGTVVDERIEER